MHDLHNFLQKAEMSSVKAAAMDTFMSLRPEFTPSNLGCIEVDLIVKN